MKIPNTCTTIIFSLFFCFAYPLLFAQISGKITDNNGQPLPFASVFIKGTTMGTSANSTGEYTLQIKPGNYEIGFYYVGYQVWSKDIVYSGGGFTLNATLSEAAYDLPELEVRADAEDPAYPIIRKVIEKRPKYRTSIQSYSCDAYIKSVFRLIGAPEFFMGQNIGDLDGWLDEDRKGILYLSESRQQFFFQAPDQRKEIMVSSKVSGNDNGFSFNRFGFIDFYSNEITLGRPIANPIGDRAFFHYRFKLHSSYYDEDGVNINKIEVIPKRPQDAVMQGFIYIIDQKWLIHSVDFILTRSNTNIDLVDSIYIKQVYLPVDNRYYPLFQQNLGFSGNLMGFKFRGDILAVSTDYQMNPKFEKGFFGREIVKVEPESNKKTDDYWSSVRPVPLTGEEEEDYFKKDSISQVRESKSYLDSMDRISNSFKAIHLFRGYQYQNSYKGYRLNINPATERYNAVQGWTLGLAGKYVKRGKDERQREFGIASRALYGFSDQILRWHFGSSWNDGKIAQRKLKLVIGNEVVDLNPENGLSRFFNAYIMWLSNESISKFYQSRYAKLDYSQYVGSGHRLYIQAVHDQRSALINRSSFIFTSKNEPFAANDALGNERLNDLISDNSALLVKINFEWRPGLRYISYPDQRFYTRSKYPVFKFTQLSGHYTSQPGADFHFSSVNIRKNNIVNTIAGKLRVNTEVGIFWKRPLYYHDFRHFAGAESTWVQDENYISGFQLLPVYTFSTDDRYARANAEWNDHSFLFDKIPWVNKLGFSLVYGAGTLHTPELPSYQELYIGIDRIGFKLFRLFRFNYVWSFMNGRYSNSGFTASMLVKL
jgi:hypothetical protein